MEDNQTLECRTEEDRTSACWADQEYGMSCAAQSVDDKSSRSEAIACWANQENEAFDNVQNVDDKSSRSEALASKANQEKECSDTARSVDDNSSQSENLQNISDAIQSNDDVPKMCENEFAINNEYRFYKNVNLLNSEFDNFVARTYTCDYKLPCEDSPFKRERKKYDEEKVPFHVEYIPSINTLSIIIPVKFMGSNDVNYMRFIDRELQSRVGLDSNDATKSENFNNDLKKLCMDSVRSVWSGEYKLYLNEFYSSVDCHSGGCSNWSNISPVNVGVSIKEESTEPFYRIFLVSRACYKPDICSIITSDKLDHDYGCCTDAYESKTARNSVILSKESLRKAKEQLEERDEEALEERDEEPLEKKQNEIAHEFGHVIGNGDEYATKYGLSRIDNAEIFEPGNPGNGLGGIAFVYWANKLPQGKFLEAYERSKGVRRYTLAEKNDLFNHDGVDYSAKEKVFKGRKGFVLYANGDELKEEIPGLERGVLDRFVDKDGMHCVYDKVLEAVEKPGMRKYDLEKLYMNDTKLYHNYMEFSVGKGAVCDGDCGIFGRGKREFFYFLVPCWGDRRGIPKSECLDGEKTSHFNMVEQEFGTDYALKNATMFSEDDLQRDDGEIDFNLFQDEDGVSYKDYLMNKGNKLKKHYYIPFKRGMVNAIQQIYGYDASEKAPNMEDDWEIK